MLLTVTQFAAYAHDEHGSVLAAYGILTLLGSLVGIETAQLLRVDKEYLAGQERLQLRIGLINQVLCTEHCRVYLAYNTLQEINVAVIGRDYTLPVPLVNIKRVQVSQALIGTDGVHIGIDSVAGLYLILGQGKTFPLGK